ncbi:MAG: glutaminase A [Actinomycetales bacterium]|nr:glutaminase A [Actinomycetales bacterium]
MTATLIILAAAIVAFVSNRIPLGIVAIGVAVSLWATGVLDLQQAMAGFGDPTVIFIAALFVVSEALEATGVTAWAGSQVIQRAGTSRVVVLVVVSLLVAVVTAFISVNGAVAALIPMVVVVASRARIPASHMLMPLAFAAHAGSLLALTGTPVNIIVSNAAQEVGGRAFGFFEFGLAGLPLLVGTILVVVLFGRALLPERAPTELPQDLSALTRTLRDYYDLPGIGRLTNATYGVTEVIVAPRSGLVGLHVFPGMATPSGDLVIVAAQRGGEDITGPKSTLRSGDTLLVSGTWEDLERHTADADVLVVNPPAELRRGVPLGRGAKRTITVLLLMVVLLATGLVPAAIAGLLAACALVLSGVLTPTQAYKNIGWTTVVLVAGMIPLSTAFITTGTADRIAEEVLAIIGDGSPHVALLTLCVLTMVLGQLISNTATVLILVPVAAALASDLSVSPLPFMMALTVAGAAAFLTPVATPANTNRSVDEGQVSRVYPSLERARREHFGLGLVGVSGSVQEVGDSRVEFTIMSVAKPFAFALAAQQVGIDAVVRQVGVDATGLPFNSAYAVERTSDGRTNPMVNAGAIATTSLFTGATPEDRWEVLAEGLSRFAGHELEVDEEVLACARETNFRNRALAMLLRELRAIDVDPLETVDLYTRQSCLRVTAVDLAVMGATLADGGVNPITGVRVVDAEVARATLVVMTVAGLYETSGDWLLRVGIPGKSGIGGGIVAVSPGKGALGSFSPPLDREGNSVRGQLAARALSRELGLDILASEPVVPVRS